MNSLKVFRRRSLLASALGLSFLSAAVNEGLRWTVTGLNRWLGYGIPFYDLGPLFLVTALVILTRQWTLKITAARLDAALGFEDRLVSFVDFAVREDIPPSFRKAQARETAEALGRVSAAGARPIRFFMFTGPLLLAASVIYPLISITPEERMVVISPFTERGDAPDAHRSRHRSATDTTKPPKITEKPPEQPSSSDQTTKGGRVPALQGQKMDADDLVRKGGPGKKPEEPSMVKSVRVGAQVSKVVDPLFATESAPAPGGKSVPKGTMMFHLLPQMKRGGGGAGAGAGEGRLNRYQIDFDSIPERYRLLVERYFTLLMDSQRRQERRSQGGTGG